MDMYGDKVFDGIFILYVSLLCQLAGFACLCSFSPNLFSSRLRFSLTLWLLCEINFFDEPN